VTTVSGVPASRKTPGVAFNVIFGGAGTSAGDAPISIMLLGNKSAAVSRIAPTYAQAAGTASVATVVSVASESDAATLFGLGSELHRMAAAVFAQQPNAALYACPVAEAGTAATAVLTFAVSASAAGTVRFVLCGEVIDVPVASGDSETTIATNCCTYVNAVTSLPYYAQFSAGMMTFTAKNTGPRANTLVVDAYFIASGAVVPTRITTSSTASGFATTGIWSSTGTLGNEITMSAGATQDSFANALSAIEPTRYGRVVGACIDATNAGRISTALASQAGPTIQILEQGIVPSVALYSDAVTSSSSFILSGDDIPALSKISLRATGAHIDSRNGYLYYVGTDNVIYQADADDLNPLLYTWKSKRFVLPQATSFSALKLDGDFDQADLVAAYNAEIAAIKTANQAIFGTALNGALNTTAVNFYDVNGSKLKNIPPPAMVREAQVLIYGDGTLQTTLSVSTFDPVRIPPFKSRTVELQISGNISVRSVAVATTVMELHQ